MITVADFLMSAVMVILVLCLLPLMLALGLVGLAFFLILALIMAIVAGVVYVGSLMVTAIIAISEWFKRTSM